MPVQLLRSVMLRAERNHHFVNKSGNNLRPAGMLTAGICLPLPLESRWVPKHWFMMSSTVKPRKSSAPCSRYWAARQSRVQESRMADRVRESCSPSILGWC